MLLAPAKVGKTLTESELRFWVFGLYSFFIFNTPTPNHPWTLIWDFILTKAYFWGLKIVRQKCSLDHLTIIFLHSSKYPAMRLCNRFRSSSGPLKDFSWYSTTPFLPCAQQIIPCPSSQWIWKNWIAFLHVKIVYVWVDVLWPTLSLLLRLRKPFSLHLRIFHAGFMDTASFVLKLFGAGYSIEQLRC